MTDKQPAALLPCPFCGSDELAHGWSAPGYNGSMSTGSVECHTCNACVWADTEAEAITAWNTRFSPAPGDVEAECMAMQVWLDAITAYYASTETMAVADKAASLVIATAMTERDRALREAALRVLSWWPVGSETNSIAGKAKGSAFAAEVQALRAILASTGDAA